MSSDGNGSGDIAGFWSEFRDIESSQPPLVFLHGSNHDELSLIDFAAQVAPGHPRYLPRGREPWESAFTFFPRNADRSINKTNLAVRAQELAQLLDVVRKRHSKPPLLLGFSSGAIIAAALMASRPDLTDGAVLFRPQRPFGETGFPDLNGMPVLIVSGAVDQRRTRSDAELLYDRLLASGAAAIWHDLPCGHDFDPQGRDMELTRAWVAKRG